MSYPPEKTNDFGENNWEKILVNMVKGITPLTFLREGNLS